MKLTYWKVLVALVLLVAIVSFLWLYQEGKATPTLLSMPYILWTGLLMTTLLVVFTYIAAKIFPFNDEQP